MRSFLLRSDALWLGRWNSCASTERLCSFDHQLVTFLNKNATASKFTDGTGNPGPILLGLQVSHIKRDSTITSKSSHQEAVALLPPTSTVDLQVHDV